MKRHLIGAILIVVGVTAVSMLGFDGSSATAAPKQNIPPFANSAGRTLDIISELKELISQTKIQNDLLRDQNRLLMSGKLEVIVRIPEKAAQPSSTR